MGHRAVKKANYKIATTQFFFPCSALWAPPAGAGQEAVQAAAGPGEGEEEEEAGGGSGGGPGPHHRAPPQEEAVSEWAWRWGGWGTCGVTGSQEEWVCVVLPGRVPGQTSRCRGRRGGSC